MVQSLQLNLVKDFMDIKRGQFLNGVRNGLYIFTDVEVYEYNYTLRASKGINLALADARDRPILRQDGSSVQVFVLSYSLSYRTLHCTRNGESSVFRNICHKCN